LPTADETLHYGTTYTEHVEHLLQQKTSRFMDKFSTQSYRGENAVPVKQYGQAEAQDEDDVFGDTPINSVPRERRWIFPKPKIEFGELLAETDLVKELTDPTSDLVKAGHQAVYRKLDDRHISAFFADVKAGKEAGDTTISFPATQKVLSSVGASGATGMNKAKLDAVITQYQKNEFEFDEPIWMAMSATDLQDLRTLYEAQDKNIRGFRFDQNDGLVGYHQINFMHSERLLTNAGGTERLLPVWVPSGMQMGTWLPLNTQVGQDSTKKFNWRVYMSQMVGAVRLQEEKVMQVAVAV